MEFDFIIIILYLRPNDEINGSTLEPVSHRLMGW